MLRDVVRMAIDASAPIAATVPGESLDCGRRTRLDANGCRIALGEVLT